MSLIYIDDTLMIDTSEIRMVYRNGNHTDIFLKDGRMYQIWDEDKVMWRGIKKAIDQVKP